MSKLQQITRSDGSVVSSVNLPKEEIEKLGWEKGDILFVFAERDQCGEFLKIIKRAQNGSD